MFSIFAGSTHTCGGSFIIEAITPASIVHGEDDALTGRRILRFTPHEPRARLQRFQHIYALFLYALFSLDYVFLRDFECFFFPSHGYLKRRHPAREYAILFFG